MVLRSAFFEKPRAGGSQIAPAGSAAPECWIGLLNQSL